MSSLINLHICQLISSFRSEKISLEIVSNSATKPRKVFANIYETFHFDKQQMNKKTTTTN